MQARPPMQKAALYFAGAFFAAGAIAHLIRLILGIQIVVDGVVAPVWWSAPGTLVAALIAAWMLIAARRA